MQVGLCSLGQDIGFGLLKVVLEHSSHPVQLQGLSGIHLLLQLLLLLFLPLLLHLLIDPLPLLILEELSPRFIL